MSLVRLRTFIEVYRQSSITKAARSLNLTQPAVSQHIAGLESTIGRPLFERLTTGMKPTATAHELATDIGDKLDAAEAALSSARVRTMDVAGALQIAGHADFMAEVLSEQLIPLLKAGIRIRIHTGNGTFVKEKLLKGHCDLGISAYPILDNRLQGQKIMTTKVVPVAAPCIVQKIKQAPHFSTALAQQPLLAYSAELLLIDRWMVKNNLNIKPIIPSVVTQDLRTQRKLLMQGFGWAIMPEFLCARQIKRQELMEIPSPVGSIEIHYYLLWTPSALRQTRVTHARKTLLQGFNSSMKKSLIS